MKRYILAIMVCSLMIGIGTPLYGRRGGGSGAAIGVGAGLGGFFLGRATAPRQTETVYVQQPAQPETVYVQQQGNTAALQQENSMLRQDIRHTQDTLTAERAKVRTLEQKIDDLELKTIDMQRTIDRLERQNTRLKRKEDSKESNILGIFKSTK